MNVLVTGGAGYIGSHVVLALLAQGHKVTVVDNLSTGVAENIPAEAMFYMCDAGSETAIRHIIEVEKIDAIMHFAGSIKVEESVSDPLKYYHNNVGVMRGLLQTAVGKVKYFVFSSSAAVYGNQDRMPVAESRKPSPTSPYGHTKLMGEQMLSDVAAVHPLHFVSLRYFNVVGVDPHKRVGYPIESQPSHLIRAALSVALGRQQTFEVFGTDYPNPDGTAIRDFIHVSDLADAHVEALRYLELGGDSTVLNCGYGKGTSVLDVLKAVKRASGKDFPVVYAARRPGDLAAVVADVTRIEQTLPSWKPVHDNLDEMVSHQFEWERLKHNSKTVTER